jgi:hypothetical protein
MISIGHPSLTFAGSRSAALALCLMSVIGAASAQSLTIEGMSAQPMADDAGLIGAITRWVDDSTAAVASKLREAREHIDGAADRAAGAAKDAATAVTRLPGTVVTGRERCERAPNGAPDCTSAIATLCRAKGFAGGRSLDIEARRTCPAEVLLSGRLPTPAECGSESFVTRAMCQ